VRLVVVNLMKGTEYKTLSVLRVRTASANLVCSHAAIMFSERRVQGMHSHYCLLAKISCVQSTLLVR